MEEREVKEFVKYSLVVLLMVGLILIGCAAPSPSPSTTPAPTPAPTPEKPIELKLSYHHPPQSTFTKEIFTPWVESIEQASNGRVKITQYPGETLVKMKDEYDAVVSGLSDIATISAAITPGRFPLSEIDLLPMLFPNAELAARVHFELLKKYCLDTEYSDVKVILDTALPPMQFFTTKPVQKLEDLKGMKMRVEGKVETWTMEALGATPLQMGTGELYSALERGLIEGIAFAYQGVLAYGFQNITKYRTVCNIYTRNFPVVMNKDVWNSLPPDIQKIFEDNGNPEVSGSYGAKFDKIVIGAVQGIKAYDKKVGNPDFFELSTAEKDRWQQVSATVWDKWLDEMNAKKLPGKAMLDDAQSLVKKYSTK